MGKIPARRNRRSRGLAAQITEQVVEQVSDALTATTPEPEATSPRPLAGPRECRGVEVCGLSAKTWSRLPVWRCGVCGFETFNKAEAATRAAVVGRSSIIGADKPLENSNG